MIQEVLKTVQNKMESAPSENDAKELNEFVLSHKEKAKNADLDLRDAKRRVSGAKAAKKPKRSHAAEHEASDANSDEASA